MTALPFTPGPWKWWTSNSWRRLRTDERNPKDVLVPTVHHVDGHPDLNVSQADMALIESAPDLYAALGRIADLEHARRAGGPAPEDLQGLDDALMEAVEIACEASAKARGK